MPVLVPVELPVLVPVLVPVEVPVPPAQTPVVFVPITWQLGSQVGVTFRISPAQKSDAWF